jgi:tripartite-type tricarboxylate transporter receptor subunit TctC
MLMRAGAALIWTSIAAVTGLAAHAQSWPAKPLRWISPFAPGGGADFTSRALAQKIGPALGQQIIVDNRGGAGGMVGVDLAAKSAPDGYTFVLGTIGPIAINPSIYTKMPYSVQRDLAPIGQAAVAVNVLIVHPSLPVRSVKELIAIASARPAELNYGSSGPGAADHLAGELFNVIAGVKMVHVPYKGGAPAILDLVGGNIQLIFSTVSTAKGVIEAKRVRTIAIAGSRRFELMPDLPTVAESGLKGFATDNWYGVFAPAGTPAPIIERMHAEVGKALSAVDVKKHLLELGIITTTSASPAAFSAYIAAETEKWGKIVRAAGIKGD